MANLLAIVALALVVVVQADQGTRPYHDALSQDGSDMYNGKYDAMDGVGTINKRIGLSRLRSKQQQQQQQEDYVPTYNSRSRDFESDSSSYSSKQRQSASNKYSSRKNYDDYYSDDSYDNKKESESYKSYEPVPNTPRRSYNINRRNGGYGHTNPFALLVAPLAGISFLAAAAALAISPAYITVTTTSISGRKKRELATIVDPELASQITPELMQKIEELQTLEKFMSTIPKDKDYQQQIMSMYLSCSGYTEEGNACLDRVFCEYGNAKSEISEEERDVLAIILYNIMGNNYVKESFKNRLKAAARHGRDTNQCIRYSCDALSASAKNAF